LASPSKDPRQRPTYEQVGEGDFVNYLAALRFSQALGNRFAEASYARARLQRSQAVVQYDRAVQGTVLAVKNALVDCVAFRELVEQNRVFRLAQAENLRALLVDEKTLAALTPEFLQLKFQLQNGLAQAEDQYFASLVGYQGALARLQQAMGTGLETRGIEVVRPGDATDDARFSVMCECSVPECMEMIELARSEYERVRSNSSWACLSLSCISRYSRSACWTCDASC